MTSDQITRSIPIVLFSLIIFFHLMALTLFIANLFVLNFSTSGINLSILLLVLFFYTIYSYFTNSEDINLTRHWLLLVVFNLLFLVPNSIITIIASSVSMMIGFVLMKYYLNFELDAVMTGLYASFILWLLQFVICDGLLLFATTSGQVLFALLNLAILPIFYIYQTHGQHQVDELNRSILPLYSSLFVMYIFLGAPYVISAWSYPNVIFGEILSVSNRWYTVLIQLSLLVGFSLYFILDEPINLNSSQYFLLNLLFLISFFDIVFTNTIPVIAHLFSSFALIAIVGHSFDHQNKFSISFIILIQFILVELVFLQVVAGNWAFVPGILHSITHGLAGFYIYLIGVTFSAISILNEVKQ